MTVRKTYVLDTNVLLSDAAALYSFEEHEVIIPMVVLEELDRMKSRPDEVGRNARQVSRTLDELRRKGNLYIGVTTPANGLIKVATIGTQVQALPNDMLVEKVDNQIIAYMLFLQEQGIDATLVSKDINVRLKCDALNIRAEDYLKMRVTSDTREFYRGVEVISLEPDQIDDLFLEKELTIDDSQLTVNGKQCKLYANQIVVVKSTDTATKQSAITRFSHGKLIPVLNTKSVFGLEPRNKEQNFSLDLLLDDDVKLITLVGPSGTGKTLLALAAALEQVLEDKRYERLIVTRPVQPVGKDIGFLPGTLEEKMEPWIAPVRDNLNFLMGSKRSRRQKKGGEEPYLALMQEKGIIELEAIAYIRGRSIPKSFIVIDEAQNLSVHELKTIITRVGDGTKIVLTGDIEQIDNMHVDAFSNGLTYAVERFKEHEIAGHVTLIKGERSQLATVASQIL